ncbi:Bacterial transcription activator, effector binding domain [compost metagenome]
MADTPFVCYYNMEMENLDVEIGFPVAKPLSGDNDIKPGIIPSQTVITSIHMGAYADAEPLYIEMEEWISENGYEAQGHVYEYYLNDPFRPEDELLTKIVMPVK